MAAALRRSGIDTLGRVPWGAFFCLLYETKQNLLDTLVGYFAAGLEGNEFCVWAVSEPTTLEEARNAMAQAVPGFEQHLAAGRIEILRDRDWYLSGDEFDLQRITGAWHRNLRGALAKGFEGMRVSGNAFWLATDYWNDFLQYKREIDRALANQRMIVLCTYSLQAVSGGDLLKVAQAHDITIARRDGVWQIVEAIGADAASGPLTDREVEVLSWAASGKSSWEIAEILSITKRTVDEHAQRAAQKLGASNRTQAVAIALRDRLIDPARQ